MSDIDPAVLPNDYRFQVLRLEYPGYESPQDVKDELIGATFPIFPRDLDAPEPRPTVSTLVTREQGEPMNDAVGAQTDVLIRELRGLGRTAAAAFFELHRLWNDLVLFHARDGRIVPPPAVEPE